MELEIYTPPLPRLGKKPCLRIYKTGTIIINAAAAGIIGLSPGDIIVFSQDKKTSDWYLSKRGSGSFTLRKYKNSGSLCFMSRALVRELFYTSVFPMEIRNKIEEVQSLAIPVARNSVEGGYYALLASGAY